MNNEILFSIDSFEKILDHRIIQVLYKDDKFVLCQRAVLIRLQMVKKNKTKQSIFKNVFCTYKHLNSIIRHQSIRFFFWSIHECLWWKQIFFHVSLSHAHTHIHEHIIQITSFQQQQQKRITLDSLMDHTQTQYRNMRFFLFCFGFFFISFFYFTFFFTLDSIGFLCVCV